MSTAVGVPSQSLVALSPAEVGPAQQQLRTWLVAKIRALGADLRDQRQNLAVAKASKWKHSGWQQAVTRTKQRMIYYAKLKAAVEAGYLIVPNFDLEVLAVRVLRETPPAAIHDTTSAYSRVETRTAPELLPPGAGRYVDDCTTMTADTYLAKDPKTGLDVKHYVTRVADYATVDFPVQVIKPEVLDATRQAMARRIFDRIGLATGRKSDPLVVGEIVDPRSMPLKGWRDPARRVSFFIAWWLNTDTL
jgi:hypothetical protein